MTEEWRDILGYEGYYQVSNLGRVRSLNRVVKTEDNKKYHLTGRVLKQSVRNKYKSVGLNKNGVSEGKFVHRLVGEAFISNPQNKSQIDHIDGNKFNNNFKNLRWVTSKENCNNPLRVQKFLGENNHFYGKRHTEETRRIIKEKQPNWAKENNPAARKVLHEATG